MSIVAGYGILKAWRSWGVTSANTTTRRTAWFLGNLSMEMARYNPFAERAGMTKICESKIDRSIVQAVAKLEELGWIPFMLAVPRYNKQMLKDKIPEVKRILSRFIYPYNRRIAGRMETSAKQTIGNG